MFKLAATSLAGTALAFGDFDNMISATRAPLGKRDQGYGYETLGYNRHYAGSPLDHKMTISSPFYRGNLIKKTSVKSHNFKKPYASRSSRLYSKDKKVLASNPVLAKPYSLGSKKSEDYVYYCRSKSC